MAAEHFNAHLECKKCGTTDRNSSGRCKTCAKASTLKWRAENAAHVKETKKAWRAANAEKIKEWAASYAEKNKDVLRQRVYSYRAKNPSAARAINAKWAAKNSEYLRVKNANWYSLNREKVAAKASNYRKMNPDKVRLFRHNRKARINSSGGVLSKGLLNRLFKLQKGICPCCRKPLGKNYHMDHIIPLAKGGTNTDDNIQLLRQKCNAQKAARHPVDFMQSRGFLL